MRFGMTCISLKVNVDVSNFTLNCSNFARGAEAETLALEKHVDFAEGRPLGVVPAPTLAHQVVNLAGTAGRLSQSDVTPVSRVHVRTVVQHLFVLERSQGQ